MLLAHLIVLALATGPAQDAAAEPQEVLSLSVGVPHFTKELVLPGSLLEATPTTIETPLILRVDSASPHGTAFRYDLEFYGLDPGDYDLTDFMRRVNGSDTSDLPAVPVRVASILLPGQIKPNPVRNGPLPTMGGYRTTLWALAVAWLLGALLLWRGRPGRAASGDQLESQRAPTLGERLLPQVEAARAGTLTGAERAELELMLIAFWRQRLELGELPAARALEQLKAHAEAGPLLRQLELWLHSPNAAPEVDLGELLAPYGSQPGGSQPGGSQP
ncbi:MAG: hypothetical protein QF615_11445, partial [Planctomycetota bacterium]|nr:hypothetical protein [Planctomycetota bacterium]